VRYYSHHVSTTPPLCTNTSSLYIVFSLTKKKQSRSISHITTVQHHSKPDPAATQWDLRKWNDFWAPYRKIYLIVRSFSMRRDLIVLLLWVRTFVTTSLHFSSSFFMLFILCYELLSFNFFRFNFFSTEPLYMNSTAVVVSSPSRVSHLLFFLLNLFFK